MQRSKSEMKIGRSSFRTSILAMIALGLVASLTQLRAVAESSGPPDISEAESLFTLQVLPLLEHKCFGCHGDDPKEIEGGFDIRSRAGILKGGESEEPSIVPGKPEDSPLYLAVRWEGLEMPPKENDRLKKQEIEYIRKWIAAGAPWPDAETQLRIKRSEWSDVENEDGIIVSTSGGLADDWTYRRYKPEDIWALQPVTKPAVPKGYEHPIDAFVGGRLAESGSKAAPQADPATLIRRATYDLIGLPPEPEKVDAFVTAWNKGPKKAWSDLIERLLQSPHYGERWGQHWLDVVRYADTSGYSNDYERSNAWRYRDYVIRSFNNDKPYDRFVIEQLAGDEWKPKDPEMKVAVGFLRMGPWGTAMVPQKISRHAYLDDVVHSVGQTFLSTAMRCCKCHDHKFDPIPTRDYYRLYAVFSATQPAELPAAFLESENRDGFEQNRQLVEKLWAYSENDRKRVVDKQEAAAGQWYEQRGQPYVPAKKRKDLPDDAKPPRHFGLDHTDEGTLKVREQDVKIWKRRLERFEPLAQSIFDGPDYKYSGAKLRKPAKVDENWRPNSVIYLGGSLDSPGDSVTPGVLSVLGITVDEAGEQEPYAVTEALSGRRLALARWIAYPQNPLTSRSIVNRIWQYHFGRGIVGTPNNFGAKGDKPTHPKLLDWLASDFVENGWKLKRLHRLIMTSRTYRQSAAHPAFERLKTQDPDNRLLAYFPPRRLTAEELRDGILAVTGELNREMGGLPIMPEINMEVALQPRMIQFSIAPSHQPSPTPQQRNRRSIYAYRVRGQADPYMEVFNQPNPNESCELRESAAVTPQALTLMNSGVMTDRSIAFALRLQAEATTLEQQIDRAFLLALGRGSSGDEQQQMLRYVRDMGAYHREHRPEPVSYPTRITRSLVEEFSGRPFEYEEWLAGFEKYTPDKKPWDVGPSARALADMCLLLFNSNEFVYVY